MLSGSTLNQMSDPLCINAHLEIKLF